MLDPLSITAAIATANTAFNGLKRAFQVGKDIQSMTTTNGDVTADCQFCGAHFILNPNQLGFEVEG